MVVRSGDAPLPAGRRASTWLYVLFFMSGFAALLYQVVWQRALFALYGINVEAVTVVVSAFMLGLGFGSLLGGVVSKNPKRPVLLMFALVELAIGGFGCVSLTLFDWVGSLTLMTSGWNTALATFALLLVPTMLMGATLPLLVAHTVRVSGNVGKSVGRLYFVNTLGSALAALAAVTIIMGPLGQAATVWFAAALNVTAGLCMLFLFMKQRRVADVV